MVGGKDKVSVFEKEKTGGKKIQFQVGERDKT